MEPALSCVAAIHPPSTGIVDGHARCSRCRGDLENAGGTLVQHPCRLALCSPAMASWCAPADGTEPPPSAVNAAGTAHQRRRGLKLACGGGVPKQHSPRAITNAGGPFAVQCLIYPVRQHAGAWGSPDHRPGGQVASGPDVEWVKSAGSDG